MPVTTPKQPRPKPPRAKTAAAKSKSKGDVNGDSSGKNVFRSASVQGATMAMEGLNLRPLDFYTSPSTLFEALEAQVRGIHPVRLLRADWVLQRAEQLSAAATTEERAALALPRRQELEMSCPEAYYSMDALRSLPTQGESQQLAICAVSHAWATADHPDPLGEQLCNLADVIRRAQAGLLPSQQERNTTYGNWRCAPLARDFGIFFDWASLCQKTADAPRTPDEVEAFSAALATMQLWYVHPRVSTIILSSPPRVGPDGGSPSYLERGWPTVESAWASLCKWKTTSGDPMLGAKGEGGSGSWPPLLDAGSESGEARRLPPIHPERMADLLATKHFTSRKADLPLVLQLYRETAISVLGGIEKLRYTLSGWGPAEAIALSEVLPLCVQADVLILFENPIGDEGVAAICASLAAGALPNLTALNFNATGIGDSGLASCANLIRGGGAPKLRRLHVRDHQGSKRAVDALVKVATARKAAASGKLQVLHDSE